MGSRRCAVEGERSAERSTWNQADPQGEFELAAWEVSEQHLREGGPSSPDEAWHKLRAMAEPHSLFAREIDAAEANLRRRRMYTSGPSITKAMDIAYDQGFAWSDAERSFVPRTDPSYRVEVEGQEVTHPDPRKVFVVYGRDAQAKEALFNYLRALGLIPLEWEALVSMTGTGSPYLGDVVIRGFKEAKAAVVLFTPDDEARLHEDLRGKSEPDYEKELTCQPRPNVLIEAGMALALHPDRTIIVQVGNIRPASDLIGRHVLRLGTTGTLLALATRLQTAGCPADLTSKAIVNDTTFAELASQQRQPQRNETSRSADLLPRGAVLNMPQVQPAPPELSARLRERGKDSHLIEIRNRGGIPLTKVRIEIAESENWHLITDVLPEYPIDNLEPRQHVRIPVSLSLASRPVVRAQLVGTDPMGKEYSALVQLSIYDS
jgi:Predicted nucleotide-binding protein containing TIR-like domain